MNFIFVNYVHPETAHVSSMRMRLFAEALTRRGHRVILLTHPRHPDDIGPTPGDAERSLLLHDWRTPFHLSCPPLSYGRDLSVFWSRSPRVMRRLLTFATITIHGGMNEGWVRGTQKYWPIFKRAFRPDLAWGICGDTSSLKATQLLARHLDIPWVADFKDHFELIIHPFARAWIASQLRDAVGFTSNSKFHASHAARYFHIPHTIVYSGVVPSMMAPASVIADTKTFRVVLVGSLYNIERLSRFLAAMRAWLNTLDAADCEKVELAYAGSDRLLFDIELAARPLPCATRILSQLPIEDLGELCKSAIINAYLWSPRNFHHKLLELLACRRPVLSFPGEHQESLELASEYGGDLRVCTSETAVQEVFSHIWEAWRAGEMPISPKPVNVDALTWDAMAGKLEAFLVDMSAIKSGQRQFGPRP